MIRIGMPAALSASTLTLGGLVALAAAVKAPLAAGPKPEVELEIAKIFWEYNATDNDLGVHVFLDGEDWFKLEITNPEKQLLFRVRGSGPYKEFGLTELFFEGAEPTLDEVPLGELLEDFPVGTYEFEGETVDGEEIEGEAEFSHAIPDGPQVFSTVSGNDFLEIAWNPVLLPPPGFPNLPIDVVAYQVIVEETFQVTVPARVHSVTVTPEFVATLSPGQHKFEVLAIEASGNQSIREATFVK
jgi:hypothetical protein